MENNYIGGQAVLHGVMINGNKGRATAIKNEKGNIELEIERYKAKAEKTSDKIPILRGVLLLRNTLESGVESFNYSIDGYNDKESSLEKWLKGKLGDKINIIPKNFTLYLSIFLSIIIFVITPTIVSNLFKFLINLNVVLTILEGLVTFLVLIGYLIILKSSDIVKILFRYHGAEHKTINCYESKDKLTVKNVKKYSRLHKRCGTNFLFNVIIVNTIISFFIGWNNIYLRIILRLVILPLTLGITYEIIKWLGQSNNFLSTIIAYPGMKMQLLTTLEPTKKEIEVAIMALKASEGLRIEKRIDELLNEGTGILKGSNIETSRLDAQLLLANILNKDKLWLITNNDFRVPIKKEEEFFKLVEKRRKKMPIKYILGVAEFMGIDFKVKEGVLIPRPDTEILVEELLKNIGNSQSMKVCDLCCGSGAIGLSLAKNRENIKVDLVDIDDVPKEVTLANIENLGFQERTEFIQSDLFVELEGRKYHIIASNPPYVKNNIIETLMDDVKNYEPHLALAGGEDGLFFYRKIVEESPKYLEDKGVLAFEIGHDQGEEVKLLMESNNFTELKVIKDLAGHDRVVMGKVSIDKEKKIML